MRIISYNINGIRSASRKGFTEWLQTDPADIICIQEVKAHESDIDKQAIIDTGYTPYFFLAQKKGYSGVGILTKIKPDHLAYGNGNEQSDFEGRILRADYGNISIISVYFPSGTTGEIRQAYKYIWLEEFVAYINELRKTRSQLIICGDYNIAHTEIDIHNPKSNKKTSGFLPEERMWFDRFLENNLVDSFRHLNKEPHHYSWWSVMRPSTRLENKGWRIDYITVTHNLKSNIKNVAIYPEVKHSDHCPVYLEIDL